MRPERHKTTLSTVTLAFIAVAVLMLGQSIGAGGEEGRTALHSRLNQPLLKNPSTSAQLISYLQRNPTPPPALSAASSLIWDSASSTPLWQQSPNERRPIASITKLVTAAVVLEHTSLHESITVSESAIATEGAAGDLRAGEKLNVATLLQAMLLESSNDAAAALAEHVEQATGESFAALMNQKAHGFGMADSHFVGPAGLRDEGAYSTAHDLALLLSRLRGSPRYADIWSMLEQTSSTAFSLDGSLAHTFKNTNPFLAEIGGVIGGKTGYTEGAGESMVLAARSPDGSRELFYIVLGSEDRLGDMRELINWVQSAYVWSRS